MTTLHVYSNKQIKHQVNNVAKGDWVYLENAISKKRWINYFKVINIDAKEHVTFVEHKEFFKLTRKFDIVLGNPPFNDNQNDKENKGNYVSASKKLHLQFIDKSLELSDNVKMVAPVRGWFVGMNKNKWFEKYKEKGLYLIENLGMPFENAVTGEIGVFHFDKSKTFISDGFAQKEPLEYSIINQFKMVPMVGSMTPGDLVKITSDKGKFKIILTSTKNCYTDDNNLFDDQTRGKWRVAFNHNGNKTGKSIYGGKMQVAAPEDYLSMSMSCFIVDSKEQAEKVCEYMMSDSITDLMREIKVSNTNTKYHMSFVPPYNG